MSLIELDLSSAIERMGDKKLFLEIAYSFSVLLPEIQDDIAAALAAGSMQEARRLVHSLKSNCASMGAEKLRAEVYTLEQACNAGDKEGATLLFEGLRPKLDIFSRQLVEL